LDLPGHYLLNFYANSPGALIDPSSFWSVTLDPNMALVAAFNNNTANYFSMSEAGFASASFVVVVTSVPTPGTHNVVNFQAPVSTSHGSHDYQCDFMLTCLTPTTQTGNLEAIMGIPVKANPPTVRPAERGRTTIDAKPDKRTVSVESVERNCVECGVSSRAPPIVRLL